MNTIHARPSTAAVATMALLAVALPSSGSRSMAGTWEIGTLAATGNVGRQCTIERDAGGNLHVATVRDDTGELIYLARVAGVWQAPLVVSTPASYTTGCDVAVDAGGDMRFSWGDPGRSALMYAGPEPVNSWTLGHIDDGPDNIGTWLSLHSRADGVLSISCANTTTGSLVFAERGVGGVWPPLETIDPGPLRGTHNDLIYRDGAGYAFAEHATAITALLYADQYLPMRTWARGTIRSDGDAGRNVSVTNTPNGRLACVYYHYDEAGLGAIHTAYLLGAADYWSVRAIVDSVGSSQYTGVASDLLVAASWRGVVSFRNDDSDDLYAAVNDSIVTAIGGGPLPIIVPQQNTLGPGFPNPFNPQTTIPYALTTTGRVSLRVYDVRGALVRTLVDEVVVAGYHRARWDGRNERGERTASGVYFMRLVVGKEVRAAKIVLVK